MHRVFIRMCLTVVACSFATIVQAQSTTRPARWDGSVVGGFLVGHSQVSDSELYSDDTYGTGEVAVTVGRYWTTHFKTEVSISGSGEGELYAQRFLTTAPPNGRYPVFSQHFVSTRAVALTANWQFFDNDWVHPFVHAGVSVDIDRSRVYAPRQTYFTGDPRLSSQEVVVTEERREGPTSTTHLRPTVGVGVKVYITPRVFFRSDAQTIFGSELTRLTFRGGLGVDF